MTRIAGLDVGGAHLKVARIENGAPIAVEQFRCRLWMGMEKLDVALAKAAPMLQDADRVAITMTGELSDIFPDRKTGVETLVRHLAATFGATTRFWMGQRGFGSAADAIAHHSDVGSTNFLATAAFVARHHPNALLIDFGSTTTDIIPILNGTPVPRGLTDGERQATGELVYTGATRTTVAAVTNRAPFGGSWVSLARENLANMADVRRILGTLADGVDLHATADGKGKSVDESRIRFARLLGRDASEAAALDWRTAAAFVHAEQLRSIENGVLQVLSAAGLSAGTPAIIAGIGATDAAEVAKRLSLTQILFADLAAAPAACHDCATSCATAVAVALLVNSSGDNS